MKPPSITTISPVSLPGFEVAPWYGFFLPAGTPPAVVAKVSADVRKMIASEEVQQALRKRGIDPSTNTPQEFAEFVRADLTKWAKRSLRMRALRP